MASFKKCKTLPGARHLYLSAVEMSIIWVSQFQFSPTKLKDILLFFRLDQEVCQSCPVKTCCKGSLLRNGPNLC